MKANELMINDKVFVKVLSQIPDTYVIHTWTAKDYLKDRLQIKPVPITEEILVKNGFVLVDDDLFEREINAGHSIQYDILHCHFDEYTETGYEEPIDEHNFHCELVSKVHELQHALRLCELAELADNFKV